MISSDVAQRYAAAIFSLATSADEHQLFAATLHQLAETFEQDKSVEAFIGSPLVRAEDKEKALQETLKDKGLSPSIMNLLLLLARKDRLSLLAQIASAYEAKADEAAHVKRGLVRTAAPMNEKQKAELQKTIEAYSKNKVILNYKEDASLLGGLTAQVGSLTFDDSIHTHLKNIKEDLNRSH